MAFDSNKLTLSFDAIAGGATRIAFYDAGSDDVDTLLTDGFFTGATKCGLRQGDVILAKTGTATLRQLDVLSIAADGTATVALTESPHVFLALSTAANALTVAGDLVDTLGYAAAGDLGNGRFYFDDASTASPDGYAVLAKTDPPPAAGRYLRMWDRPPRPQDFGGSDVAAIERAATYAASQIGEMQFAGAYEPATNVNVAAGVVYRGRSAALDCSARTDSILNGYTDGILTVPAGTKGTAVSLAVDIEPTTGGPVKAITASSGTASIETYAPHGFSVGDYVWMIFAAGFSALPDGMLYFVSQGIGTTTLPRTLPFLITAVADSTHFSYAVDNAAPSSISASSVFFYHNDVMVKTSTAHGLAVNQYIEITSTALIPVPSGDQTIAYAEKLRVQRVVDTETVIVDAPPKHPYLVANDAVVSLLSLAKTTEFHDLLIIGRGSTGTATSGDGDSGIACDLIERFLARHVVVKDCERFSFCIQRPLIADHQYCRAIAHFSDDAGRTSGVTKEPYAFCYGGHAQSVKFDHCSVAGTFRHGIVEATIATNPGYTQTVEIDTPDIRGTVNNCIACHSPNEGYTVRGGYLSGNQWGIDSRTGNLLVDGTQGSGGWGLINASGSIRRLIVKHVRGANYARPTVFIAPESSSGFTPDLKLVSVRDVYSENAEQAVLISADGTTRAERIEIENIQSEGSVFAAVSVTLDATNKGEVNIRGVRGNNTATGQSTKAVVALTNVDGGFVDNIVGSCTSGTLVPVSTSNVTGVCFGRNIPGQAPASATIASGILTLSRTDDHAILVGGEGGSADNLDKLSGLAAGQRAVLCYAGQAITVRDIAVSGATLAAGGIKTPDAGSVILSSNVQEVTVYGQPDGAGGVNAVVVGNTVPAVASDNKTIASGVVTLVSTAPYSVLRPDTEGGASADDLDTITAASGTPTGKLLLVRSTSGTRDVTLKNGTGNMTLGADVVLDTTSDAALLAYTGTGWTLASAAANNS